MTGAAQAPSLALPAAVSARGMTKTYSGVAVLDDVELTVARGSVHALLGGNGSGKSTLIKALAGIAPADAGEIAVADKKFPAPVMTPRLARACGLRFVHQQLSVFPALTVADNLAMGHGWEAGAVRRIRWREQHERAKELLGRFDIRADPRAPLGMYNMATHTMVAVARAMQDLDDAGVLVLDEPTSAFPPAQVDMLLEFVCDFAARGHAVIYVTHRLDEVVQIADRVSILRDGHNDAVFSRDELSHQRLAEAIMGTGTMSVAARRKATPAASDVLVEVEALAGGPIADATFSLRAGEIVGLAGLLGSGRTSLLKLMFGAMRADRGTLTLGGIPLTGASPRAAMSSGIAYVPEDRAQDAAFSAMTVKENLALARSDEHFVRGRIRHRAEDSAARRLMTEFHIKASSTHAPMSTLSGGNQQKVVLARWLRRKPRLILLDEPTQGVDVNARSEIWHLVRQAVDGGACALVATSDFDEMALFCDRALVLREGQVAGQIEPHDMSEHNIQRNAFGLVGAST